MSKKIIPILAALFVSSAVAQSQTTYAEVGGVYARYEEPGAWFTSGVANVKLGVNLSENVALEGMVGTSIADTQFYVGTTLVSARIDSMLSGFVKLKAPLSQDVDVFARLGYTQGRVSANSRFGSGWVSGSSASYGAGIQFKTSSSSYMNIDYMSYYSGAGITVSGMGVHLGTQF